MYPLIKYIHVAAAGLSFGGFVLRGYWRRRAPLRLRHPLVRTLPHLNDTVLLASAAGMLLYLGWWPGDHPWIAAKLSALVAYVIFGALALRGPGPRIRLFAFVAAVGLFLYIVSVALTKQVCPLS